MLTALDDPTLRAGFPKRLGTGGEAPLRYADLNGDNEQELVLPTEDGTVHAYRPDGTELPGWPVQTQIQSSAAEHTSASPALGALDPPLRAAARAHDRRPDRRRPARGDHRRRRAHLRVGGRRRAARRLARAPRPGRVPTARRPSSRRSSSTPSAASSPRPAVARLEGPASRRRSSSRASTGTCAPTARTARVVPGLPGAPAGPRRAGRRADDRRVDQQPGDRRPRRRRQGRHRGRHQRGLRRRGRRRRRRGLRRAAGRGGVDQRACTRSSRRRATFLAGWPIKPGGIIQNVLPLIGPGHDPALVKVGGDAEGRRLGHRQHGDQRVRRGRRRSTRRSSRPPAGRARSTCSSRPRSATWTAPGRAGRRSSSTSSTSARRRTCCWSARTCPTATASARTTPATGATLPRLPGDHRRLPVPVLLDDRQGGRRRDEPGARRHRASGCCTPTTA